MLPLKEERNPRQKGHSISMSTLSREGYHIFFLFSYSKVPLFKRTSVKRDIRDNMVKFHDSRFLVVAKVNQLGNIATFFCTWAAIAIVASIKVKIMPKQAKARNTPDTKVSVVDILLAMPPTKVRFFFSILRIQLLF